MTLNAAGRRSLPGLTYPEDYLRRLADELTEKFTGIFNRETVERYDQVRQIRDTIDEHVRALLTGMEVVPA